jgi:hypothetical protein
MKSYRGNHEVQEVLARLEATLETYLAAWRQEFGVGGENRSDSQLGDLRTRAVNPDAHETRSMTLDRR